eukprot:12302974-Prorocentrum_lima.AAC.1
MTSSLVGSEMCIRDRFARQRPMWVLRSGLQVFDSGLLRRVLESIADRFVARMHIASSNC